METKNPKGARGTAAVARMLRLAGVAGVPGTDDQLDLYMRRASERMAHMVPDNAGADIWKQNMDYVPDEASPYSGNASDFMRHFPGGIPEWRKWRERQCERRERKHRIASLMPGGEGEIETLLREAWRSEAHFVPEGGDDVAELGDKEPKLWSDNPKWRSIGEFLKAHREHFGQEADDAALKAARDFVKYWKLTTRKPKGERR